MWLKALELSLLWNVVIFLLALFFMFYADFFQILFPFKNLTVNNLRTSLVCHEHTGNQSTVLNVKHLKCLIECVN